MTRPRRAHLFLASLGAGLGVAGILAVHAGFSGTAAGARLDRLAGLAARLGLTDLCLFTDARYTRHPALADLHTPFQDSPLSFEHFPSGSLLPPPPHLRGEPR
ncbi:MAG: hypothetical protein HZB55_06010 [Deltaproteobacteria bacterium]|nr:hypothetical protein [Deltaproteobacteria bacterium]